MQPLRVVEPVRGAERVTTTGVDAGHHRHSKQRNHGDGQKPFPPVQPRAHRILDERPRQRAPTRRPAARIGVGRQVVDSGNHLGGHIGRGRPPGRITVRLPTFVPMRMPSHHSTYHSMSAIGVGAGFTSSPTTLPERKRTTLCAIGASAELWVMMSTVMFSSRQMSCSSCRTSLPVS